MKLTVNAIGIILAGLITGAIVDYGLDRGVPGDALLPAFLGALVLGAVWLTVSFLLGKASGTGFGEATARAAFPFILFALPLALFLPVAAYQAPFEPARFEAAGYFPQLLPLATQTYIVLAAAAGLTTALLAWRFPLLRRGPLNAAAAHPGLVLGIAIAVWVAVASLLDILNTMYLNDNINAAVFADSLRNVASDQGFLYSTLYQAEGASLLGLHASFIWLLIYPLFVLFPSYQSLQVVTDLALGLAAIPVYFLSRRYFSTGTALLMTLAFLLCRLVVGSPAAGELTEERFMPLFLISAFYFWHERRFAWFAVFSLLALSVREDAGLIIVMFGILSLFQRRSWHWSLVPIAVGGAWVVVMIKWLIPAMSPVGRAMRITTIYAELGDSAPEIVLNSIRRPWRVIEMMLSSDGRKLAAFTIWQSFGFGLPLLSTAVVLGITPVAELLLDNNAYTDHLNMPVIAAALFPALILAIARVDRIAARKGHVGIAAALVVVVLFTNIAQTYSWYSPSWYRHRYNYRAAVDIMAMVPPDASLYLPSNMAILAEPGQHIHSYQQLNYQLYFFGSATVDTDYAILDTRQLIFDFRTGQGYAILERYVDSSGDYSLLYEADGLRLYQRTGTGEPEPIIEEPVLE